MYHIVNAYLLFLIKKNTSFLMNKLVNTYLLCLSLLLLICACVRKAEDYSSLVKAYKKICCKNLSSNTMSIKMREQAIRKKIKLEEDFKEALRYLKQDDKEKLTEQWLEVIYDAKHGKCN